MVLEGKESLLLLEIFIIVQLTLRCLGALYLFWQKIDIVSLSLLIMIVHLFHPLETDTTIYLNMCRTSL